MGCNFKKKKRYSIYNSNTNIWHLQLNLIKNFMAKTASHPPISIFSSSLVIESLAGQITRQNEDSVPVSLRALGKDEIPYIMPGQGVIDLPPSSKGQSLHLC